MLFGIVLAALLGVSFVQAADLMSFTANVKDASGNPMSSGNLTIEIYDAMIGS